MWVAASSEGSIAGEDGSRRRQRKFFYGDTAAEARAARDKYLIETTGKAPEPEVDASTVAQYAVRFLDHVQREKRATTHRSYEQVLRLHVLPSIGSVRLADLSSAHVKALYQSNLKSASRSMQARIHVTLRVLLNFAREEGVLQTDPLATIRQAAPRHKLARIESLTEAQVAQLMKAAQPHRLGAMILLAITTGMRQGELFALRWSDVDIARRALSVVRSAQELDGEITIVEPKTATSRRRITLPLIAVNALKARRVLANNEEHDSDLVFPGLRGTTLRKSNFIRRDWKQIQEAAGLSGIRFHTLRHTAASLLLSAGVNPKIVQELLGHASIRLTLETYSHLLPTLQATAADAFDQMLAVLCSQAAANKQP